MKFREHRGSLAASMETTVELKDKEALVEHCQKLLATVFNSDFVFHASDIEVKDSKYYENFNDWGPTFMVVVKGVGVIGFTDTLC